MSAQSLCTAQTCGDGPSCDGLLMHQLMGKKKKKEEKKLLVSKE